MTADTETRPPAEVTRDVLLAFWIADASHLLSPLTEFEGATPLPRALIETTRIGLSSVISAGTLPYRLVNHSALQRRFDRFAAAERIRALKDVKAGEDLSDEQDRTAIQIANRKLSEFAISDEGTAQFRNDIVYGLHAHLSSVEVSQAASELLVQALVSSWSVFESAVRSFIIDWINEEASRAIPVLHSPDLKSYFGKQAVDLEIIGEHGFDLKRSMGDILFRDRRLDSLSTIRSALDALFASPEIREALGDDIWTLNQRRHLFVHRRGIVDREYLRKTSDPVPLGERLHVSSDQVEHDVRAIQSAVLAIATAAEAAAESHP